MSKGKGVLIFLVLTICFILIVWIIWTSYSYVQNRNNMVEDKSGDENVIVEIDADKILKINLETDFQDDKSNGELRTKIIDHIEENINSLTPFLSNLKEKWEIERFSFIADDILYVVYQDKDVIGRILVRCQENNDDINCLRVSYFVPDNYSWKLEKGENSFYDREVQHYEKNSKGSWKKTYTSDKVTFFPISPGSLQGFQELVDYNKETWRLDPLEVVKYEIYDVLGFDLGEGKYKLTLRKDDRAQVKVNYNKSEYIVYLYQPVKKGDEGVWVMEKMIKTK